MNRRLISKYWTPEQALAVYEFIDTLRDEIWNRYDRQIIEQLQREHCTDPDQWGESESVDDFNDQVPF